MNRFRILVSTAALLCASIAAPPAVAGIRYVDASATTGANDGSSWADAFQGASGLRLALAAAVSGDQIWVADGTYLPTLSGVRTRSLDLKSGVAVYGGFAGGETSLSQRDPALHVAVLSGDLAGDDGTGSYGDNSYHVVAGRQLGSGALLDGFTIRGGNADGPPSPTQDDGGGGLLFVSGSGAPVRRCVFESNRCVGMGGAVFADQSCCTPSFEDCRFVDNVAGVSGGAVQLLNSGDLCTFTRCIFTGNSAPNGSAVDAWLAFDVFFQQCLLYGNTATGSFYGGAIYAHTESYPWILSTTIAANTSTVAPPARPGLIAYADAWVFDSIAYFNTGPGGAQGSANQIVAGYPHVKYSCVQGGYSGTAVISADPLFANAGSGDFRLTPSSPCVDSGDNSLSSSAFDLDSTPRFEDVASTPDSGAGTPPIIDRGAYETPGGLYAAFCAGDGSLATACPCGNFGTEGHGCKNSALNSPGSLLAAAGTASPDTVVLTASGVRAGVLCIFLQGNAPVSSGVIFGDGVRCAGGALKRIAAKSASSGGIASYPGFGDTSISSRSSALGDPIQSGSLRWYQTWYRDNSASFCPPPQGGTSNVSSGVIVSW